MVCDGLLFANTQVGVEYALKCLNDVADQGIFAVERKISILNQQCGNQIAQGSSKCADQTSFANPLVVNQCNQP